MPSVWQSASFASAIVEDSWSSTSSAWSMRRRWFDTAVPNAAAVVPIRDRLPLMAGIVVPNSTSEYPWASSVAFWTAVSSAPLACETAWESSPAPSLAAVRRSSVF